MRSQSIIALLSSAFIGQALAAESTNAKPVTGNPAGVVYKATLPEKPYFKNADIEGNVKGSITGISSVDGEGVIFTVKFENLPKEGGPFSYHLHAEPVANGDCNSTKAHLDPFGRGQDPPCDLAHPETCEVGDLSGKHGKIVNTTSFSTKYLDLYASTLEDTNAFFGNRSFVIHYANGTRLTCANFEQKAKPMPGFPTGGDCSVPPTSTVVIPSPPPTTTSVPPVSGPPTMTPTPTPTPTPIIAGAPGLQFSAPLMLAGLAAAIFAF